jgi:hypothetical protein
MGRMYSASFDNASVTNDADQDIWEFVNASTSIILLHEFQLYSATTTDERLRLRIVRRTTTGTGGGTALTKTALDQGNSVASGATITPLVTAPGTAGNVLKAFYWSQLSPLIYLPTPEARILISASSRLSLNLETAVSSTRSMSGYLVYEELS